MHIPYTVATLSMTNYYRYYHDHLHFLAHVILLEFVDFVDNILLDLFIDDRLHEVLFIW